MGLYEQIKDIAKDKGYSINKLEKELGFARSSISKFNTNTPSIDKISKIAEFLDVSVNYLMTGEEKENKMPIFEYSSDIMELIKLYSQLNKEQKSAILNMMRSFALTNQ